MSKAEDLLNSLDSSDPILYTAEPETEGHIVIGSDRYITIPESLKRLAVQYDHNIETVTFDCPRYWDGTDMSGMAVYINYRRADGYSDAYPVSNVTVDPDDSNLMHFDWKISRNVTSVAGNLTILICIKETDTDGYEITHWNSELNSDLTISGGMECSEQIVETYSDALEQWKYQLIDAGDSALFSIEQTKTNVINSLNIVKDNLKQEIQTKGAETLATIPENYNAMDTEVKALRSDLTEMKNGLTLIDESTGISYRLSVIDGKLTITENEEA